MESVIKLINEENHVRYDSAEDEANLIYYIMRIDKTFEDTVRPGRAIAAVYRIGGLKNTVETRLRHTSMWSLIIWYMEKNRIT